MASHSNFSLASGVEEMMEASGQSNGAQPARPAAESTRPVVILFCPRCMCVQSVAIGRGDLTCGCGTSRRILRIVEEASAS